MAGRPLVFGHRGASRERPENTLAAFAKARELGADGVELDVRRTADGVLVVHHDPDVEGLGPIYDQPFSALRSLRPDVPTLADALEACAGMLVNVEMKCLPWEPDADTPDREVVRGVAALLRITTTVPLADVIVSSFDLGAVDAMRALAPDITTAWLTSGQEVAAASVVVAEHGHAWLHPDREAALRASPADFTRAHELGLRINVWTVDEPDEMTTLVAAGADAIITNVPDVAVGVVTERRR